MIPKEDGVVEESNEHPTDINVYVALMKYREKDKFPLDLQLL